MDLTALRAEFAALENEVTPFAAAIKLAARVACVGIAREVGTVNDETARFIYDADTGEPVAREALKAEIVQMNGLTGVRIVAHGYPNLELRAHGLRELLHPRFSFHADGTVKELVLFPEIIAAIARSRGVELVLVKSWGMNSIFGGFDPAKAYYQTNFWELENNDSQKFASLVRANQLAFLGTHDLIAHVAGLRADAWPRLRERADRAHQAIQAYFAAVARPTIAALILPYTLGVVLDDLAQPPSYDSTSHVSVFEEVLKALNLRAIRPDWNALLTQFPAEYEALINLSRRADATPNEARATVERLVHEVLSRSLLRTA